VTGALVPHGGPGPQDAIVPEDAAVLESTRLTDLEYVVVDVETTGGSALRGHRVTEIAAVRVRGTGEVAGEFATLVNPERRIPPFVTRLTRITDGMVRHAPRFDEIAADVQALLRGRVFVAHNARFDWAFLDAELSRARGLCPPRPLLCTVRLARRLVPEISSRSLDALCYYFGIENEARHRAYGDARDGRGESQEGDDEEGVGYGAPHLSLVPGAPVLCHHGGRRHREAQNHRRLKKILQRLDRAHENAKRDADEHGNPEADRDPPESRSHFREETS
jgi:DNA polymerase III epsilon subunit family exonuclease